MLFKCAIIVFVTALWADKAYAQTCDEPCAQVSAQWAAQRAANATARVVVDGQLAYDCLTSVPLNEENAVRLVRSIQPFLDWQSTSSYLRDPPEDYPFPAFDIAAAFEDIISNIQTGEYENEWEFQNNLSMTFSKAKDGHFRYGPDLLTAAISFRRGDLALVSVSLDGTSVPEIYVLSDIRLYNRDSSFTPSPVSSLNGEDPVATNEDLSLLGDFQDRDTLYNTMFYSPALAAVTSGDWQGYYGGSGRYGYVWPGSNTAVEFENGTVVNYPTIARIVGNFSGITDGPSFYAKYCSGTRPVAEVANPPAPTPPVPANTSAPQGNLTAPPPLGYPTPVVIASDQSAAGYFLPNTDVAVLSLLTYGPEIPAEFQRAVQTLIEDAKAAGKTKLIVDVSANGGGLIFQGHDTFRQLFPQIQQDGFNRFRSVELLQIAAQQFSGFLPADFDPETSGDDTLISIYESYFNYRYDLNVANKSFTSAEDKFSSDTFNGDNFTQIHRWNFDDPLTTINETYGVGFDVTGYRSRQNFTQPFAAEDIILLYDGYCASTCTLFSEFLRVQAGVRSVTFGGRPGLDDDGNVPIIQNYGGVKGANNVGYSYFNFIAETSLAISEAATINLTSSELVLSQSEVDFLNLNLDTYALNRSTDTSINIRDNILRDRLDDGLPAQFVFEPTDCRLFYTPLSIVDPMEQWRLAAEAAWGDGACVAGSLQESSSERRLKRDTTSTANVQMGKVISMPEKAPTKKVPWTEGVPV